MKAAAAACKQTRRRFSTSDWIYRIGGGITKSNVLVCLTSIAAAADGFGGTCRAAVGAAGCAPTGSFEATGEMSPALEPTAGAAALVVADEDDIDFASDAGNGGAGGRDAVPAPAFVSFVDTAAVTAAGGGLCMHFRRDLFAAGCPIIDGWQPLLHCALHGQAAPHRLHEHVPEPEADGTSPTGTPTATDGAVATGAVTGGAVATGAATGGAVAAVGAALAVATGDAAAAAAGADADCSCEVEVAGIGAAGIGAAAIGAAGVVAALASAMVAPAPPPVEEGGRALVC